MNLRNTPTPHDFVTLFRELPRNKRLRQALVRSMTEMLWANSWPLVTIVCVIAFLMFVFGALTMTELLWVVVVGILLGVIITIGEKVCEFARGIDEWRRLDLQYPQKRA